MECDRPMVGAGSSAISYKPLDLPSGPQDHEESGKCVTLFKFVIVRIAEDLQQTVYLP